jgi:hypothetical protein
MGYSVLVCHCANTCGNTGVYESFQWGLDRVLLASRFDSMWNTDQLERHLVQSYPNASSIEEARNLFERVAVEQSVDSYALLLILKMQKLT